MRLQIFSDLHFECHPDGGVAFVDSLDSSAADVAILAGDIATVSGISRALLLFAEKFKQVVYVNGNHELWGGGIDQLLPAVKFAQSKRSNIHWLQNDILEIEGHRFLGTTLWFKDDPLNQIAEKRYGDFKRIPKFRFWVYRENAVAQRFLSTETQKGDIVITHMAPSSASITETYRGDMLNRFYHTELSDLILDHEPKLWIHGHMHESLDYTLGSTRVICNPLGYLPTMKNPSYDERKIIEV